MGWLRMFTTDDKTKLISEYARELIKKSSESAKAIRDKKNETSDMTDEEWMKVFFEFLYFFLHLTDRNAFGVLDEKRRGKIMSELEILTIPLAVQTVCQSWPDEMVEKIKEECMHNFFVSMDEYGKYKKWFPEKEEGMKDTLIWEFSKNIARFATEESDLIILMLATEVTVQSYTDLNKTGFIEKIKNATF